MSVISSSKVIFCEGTENSLDTFLLDRILETITGQKPTIVPYGSKFSFSVFAQGYFAKTASNQKYLSLRDRDFDVQPSADVELIPLNNKKIWLTHRTCIENYLLDAELIHQYWSEKYQEKQDNPSSKWGHNNSPGKEAISAWIESGARSIKDYQAVRWALGDLAGIDIARTHLKTTWTKGSGQLPSSLILQDCENEAIQLINEFKEAIETVTQEKFQIKLNEYQQRFNQEEFWNNKLYLIWFNGKDIQKAMQKERNDYIDLKRCFEKTSRKVDITQHPDLMELKTKIQQL